MFIVPELCDTSTQFNSFVLLCICVWQSEGSWERTLCTVKVPPVSAGSRDSFARAMVLDLHSALD